MGKNAFPCHDDGTRLTPEELAAEREKMGQQIRAKAMEMHSLRAQLHRAQKNRDGLIAGYVDIYDGNISDAAHLAMLDRSAVSKIINPKGQK